jgi:hypothetical protein
MSTDFFMLLDTIRFDLQSYIFDISSIPCSQKSEINALKQMICFSCLTHSEPLDLSGISRFNNDLFFYFHLVMVILYENVFSHFSHQMRQNA